MESVHDVGKTAKRDRTMTARQHSLKISPELHLPEGAGSLRLHPANGFRVVETGEHRPPYVIFWNAAAPPQTPDLWRGSGQRSRGKFGGVDPEPVNLIKAVELG
jgi:hypothetical protein